MNLIMRKVEEYDFAWFSFPEHFVQILRLVFLFLRVVG